jgi:hypothetical protein
LNCWVHSHTGFESVTSAKKVSFSAFALLASEPVIFATKVLCNTFASLVCAPIALTNKIEADLDFSDLQSQIFIGIKADSDFRDLQCQFFNNIISDLDFSDFQHQLIINIKADSNFNQFLSLILHQAKPNQPQANQSMLYPSAVNQTNPSITSLLPHFSWLLHQAIGYQKPFQVSTESKQMQTCKPRATFNKELRPISMSVVSTS